MKIYLNHYTEVFHMGLQAAIINSKKYTPVEFSLLSFDKCTRENASNDEIIYSCVWKPHYQYDPNEEYEFWIYGSFSGPGIILNSNNHYFTGWATFARPNDTLDKNWPLPQQWGSVYLYHFYRDNIDKSKNIVDIDIDLRVNR